MANNRTGIQMGGGKGSNVQGKAPGTSGSKASIKDYSIGGTKPSHATSGVKSGK